VLTGIDLAGEWLNTEHHIQIAALPAADRVALSVQSKGLAPFDSGWESDANLADPGMNTRAVARFARCSELAIDAVIAALLNHATALPAHDASCAAAI
jgi:hypothetical protein